MIALILLIALCYYGAYSYHKKRKFYRDHGVEVTGEVVFFEKRRGWKGQKGWRYYLLKVVANGQDYLIETDNSKARKYEKNPQITLLVPETLENPMKSPEFQQLEMTAHSPEERQQLEALYMQSEQMERDLESINTRMRSNFAIIKEDLPSAAGVWFLGIFGTVLLAGTIFGVIIEYFI